MKYDNASGQLSEPTNREINNAYWEDMADRSVEKLAPSERRLSLARTQLALGFMATPDAKPLHRPETVDSFN